MARYTLISVAVLTSAFASTALATVFPITSATASATNRQAFNAFSDVWEINVNNFPVNGPLVFASAVGGDAGLLGTSADNASTFASNANVIVLQNFDNNDTNGFPANWDNSFNARNALRAIANNTDGDRPGFFLYWNEKLGVNRLAYTPNLNNGEASISILFAINSFNLLSNNDDLALNPTFRGEANANFFNLTYFTPSNFAFVPAPGTAALVGLAGLVATRRRR
jgi:hypothetical protein